MNIITKILLPVIVGFVMFGVGVYVAMGGLIYPNENTHWLFIGLVAAIIGLGVTGFGLLNISQENSKITADENKKLRIFSGIFFILLLIKTQPTIVKMFGDDIISGMNLYDLFVVITAIVMVSYVLFFAKKEQQNRIK